MAEEKIYYCVGCGKKHNKEKFYVSDNSLHANGTLPYCKDFIKKYSYKKDKTVDLNKFQSILMQMNLPFLQDIYKTTLEAKGDTIGNYFRQLNSLPQYKGFTWKHSDFGVIEEVKENEDKNKDVSSEDILSKKPSDFTTSEISKLEEKWGSGYSPEELYLFEKKYNMLKNNYNEKTAMHTEALFNYIRYRVKEEVATAEGNVTDAKAWGALASKAATDAKINPSQLSKADLSDGLSTFSELSQAVEKEVDIIKILPRFKYRPNDALDFNIWCYINYARELSGLPPCEYEDVYAFYDKRVDDYINQYGDPYGMFTDDPSKKNRENIKKFINEDGDK